MRAALLLLAALVPACVAPVVQRAGTRELGLERLPEGSTVVEIPAADGVVLRGVHVPAPGDAPLVVHFLPSATSITTGLGGVLHFAPAEGEPETIVHGVAGMRETLAELSARGFASLLVDYRGVGASGGERDPRRLADDAWAIWRAALERTGGRSGRVVLRAASVGAIPSASLIERGARPAGWVLFAPIRPDTIARRGAQRRYGTFLGWLTSLFLRAPSDVDLVGAVESTDVQVLLMLAEHDELLPAADREAVLEAARAAGHEAHVLDRDHGSLILRAYGFQSSAFEGVLDPTLLPPEAAFLERLDLAPPR